MNAILKPALHTLWQAAVASGGVGVVVDSVAGGKINVSGVEQGSIAAGIAVGAAALSLLLHGGQAVAAKLAVKSRAAGDVEQAMLAMVREYQASHAAPVTPHSI